MLGADYEIILKSKKVNLEQEHALSIIVSWEFSSGYEVVVAAVNCSNNCFEFLLLYYCALL